MLLNIVLAWVAVVLEAPAWVWVLLIIAFIANLTLNTIRIADAMSKINKDEINL